MSNLTQENRLISIKTPLPHDELLLTSFEGAECLSDLFEFQIEVLSANLAVDPKELIGKAVTVSIHDKIGREFNGYINSFTNGEVKEGKLASYRMTMVPWLWFLSKNNNHRIFQEKTTKDIVTQIFADLGFNDFDFKATGNPNVREYCVQYNESDLNFIARLLEEDGITYFFEQVDGIHKMQIVDEANAYQECEETDLTYSKGNRIGKQITQWVHDHEFRKGKWSLSDYDFKQPTKSQLQTTASTSEFANAKEYEHYEYSPYYDFTGIRDLSKKRIEVEEIPMNVIRAAGNCSSFYAGGTFNLKNHHTEEETGSYLITRIHHSAYEHSYFSKGGNESEYSNNFTCIPSDVHFRPQLLHPKPVMAGPQSAIVVGPEGEEIYVDEYGRIKVQFHWDRIGTNDEYSTCYIQVMQPWAGSGWGTSFIPRIGMEVVVNYYNGDVDRPIIMGTVYNGDNTPPFESKNQSGIKTRSTTGGSSSNCNELRFDDSKGSEEIFIQAEKDYNVEVKNDFAQTVNNNLTQQIVTDKTITVGENHIETIGGNTDVTIAGKYTLKVGEKDYWTIGNTAEGYLGLKSELVVGAKSSVMVGGVHETLIGAKATANFSYEFIVIKGAKTTIVDAKETRKSKFFEIEATVKCTIKSPHVEFNVGNKFEIEAGGTTIIVDSGGVKIVGDVNITGDVKVAGSITASKNLSAKNFKSS